MTAVVVLLCLVGLVLLLTGVMRVEDGLPDGSELGLGESRHRLVKGRYA